MQAICVEEDSSQRSCVWSGVNEGDSQQVRSQWGAVR